jgi:hypothetical protein
VAPTLPAPITVTFLRMVKLLSPEMQDGRLIYRGFADLIPQKAFLEYWSTGVLE